MNNSKYPPPEAFGISSCKRGRFTLHEVSTGFYLEIQEDRTRWLSDGVDMFFNDNHESISPGTLEWWVAAYHWLIDEEELIEAYFPEVRI